MSDLTLARAEAISAYTVSRIGGLDRNTSAQLAWLAARQVLTHLRAPYWDEQVHINTGRRRSYISPLGRVLGVGTREYGRHCAAYPRTKVSHKAAEVVVSAILDYLETYYVRAIESESFSQINEAYDL